MPGVGWIVLFSQALATPRVAFVSIWVSISPGIASRTFTFRRTLEMLWLEVWAHRSAVTGDESLRQSVDSGFSVSDSVEGERA